LSTEELFNIVKALVGGNFEKATIVLREKNIHKNYSSIFADSLFTIIGNRFGRIGVDVFGAVFSSRTPFGHSLPSSCKCCK